MKIVNFFRLKSEEKLAFFQALYWVIYFRKRLHRSPLNILLEKTAKKSEKYLLSNMGTSMPADRIARSVLRASCFVPGSTCLVQVLAGKVLFTLHSYAATVKIGVKKDDSGGIDSHAWLVHEGEAVLGDLPDLDHFEQILERR